jgi:hypothetical protein
MTSFFSLFGILLYCLWHLVIIDVITISFPSDESLTSEGKLHAWNEREEDEKMREG